MPTNSAAEDGPSLSAAPGRFRVPGEWEPHGGCLMAWPWSKRIWGGLLSEVQQDVARTVRTVARFEPVLLLAHPRAAAQARRACGRDVHVVNIELDDMWVRDSGPVFAVGDDNGVIGVSFAFNGWGYKTPLWQRDATLARRLCERLSVPCRSMTPVVEGGAVITDGQGTLIVTEECLLNDNRNPGATRMEIERALLDAYGATTVIWLPYGLYGGYTGGHVDGVAAFIGPGRVLAQTTQDTTSPDQPRLARNLEVLRASTDAMGRRLEIIEITQYPTLDGASLTYLNFYLAKGAVIVPTGSVPEDDRVLDLFTQLLPEREVVGVPVRAITAGGGGVHCATHALPAQLDTERWRR